MATEKRNQMKYTLWTHSGLRMDVPGGTISACVLLAFTCIAPTSTNTAAEMREKILKLMQIEHERLLKEGL